MEDDTLDFGDLDDFDTQDGLLDQTGDLSNIEDLAALEKELGIDDFGSVDIQPSVAKTEPPPSSASEPKKSTKQESTTTTTSSGPSTTPSDNTMDNKSNTSRPLSDSTTGSTTSSSNNRPFVARNKHQYQKRYSPYQQQQQHYPTMPYQGLNFFPMPGGMPYGQGFMNMAMQGGMMGLPMMGYHNNNINNNSMSNGPATQSRRIHVNPKFAGARPPLPQTQQMDATKDDSQQQQQQQQLQQRNSINREQVDQSQQRAAAMASLRKRKEHTVDDKQYHHERQDDRKRPREYDGGHDYRQITPTSSSSQQTMDQPFQRRRLDPVSSPVSSSRNHTSSGISIRGAALAAATSTTNGDRDRYSSSSPSIRNQPSAQQQQQPFSTRRTMTENTNTNSITSRLNLNNKHQMSPNDKSNNSILQRLGGRNSNDTKPDCDRTNPPTMPSTPNNNNNNNNNKNGSLTPQYANGKSSKLIISNLSSGVTEADLKALEPKDVKDVSLNRQDNQATLLFMAIDTAVNFRRKYNRTMVGGQHISVTFAKP